jgi:hypothetical protein
MKMAMDIVFQGKKQNPNRAKGGVVLSLLSKVKMKKMDLSSPICIKGTQTRDFLFFHQTTPL